MDSALWASLQTPENKKSSLELAAEQRAQDQQRALQNVKKPVTQAERAESQQRFAQIQAQNTLDDHLEQTGLIETRKAEVKEQILAALKDVTTPEESLEVCRRAAPLLARFVTSLSDFQITEWAHHTVESIRNEKAAKQLAGLE